MVKEAWQHMWSEGACASLAPGLASRPPGLRGVDEYLGRPFDDEVTPLELELEA